MPLVLNEEQNILRDAAKDFCTNQAPIGQLRRLRDARDETGFDPDTWQQMVTLGWAGITIPEAYGGLGFGYMGMGVVLEECGRTLAASPLLATAVLGSSALLHGGSETQKAELLGQIADGKLLLALALEETPHHDPYGTAITTATRMESESDGESDVSNVSNAMDRLDDSDDPENYYRVTGSKKFVLDGHVADKLVVVARSSGKAGDREGLTLVLVDREAEGVSVTRTTMVDSRNTANIEFDGTVGTLLGQEGEGADILDKVLDTGRILLAAEMLGGVQECFERTVEYLKTREQFGVPIGSFQALKHRAAEMFCEVELAKSVVLQALSALDNDPEQVPFLASLAKARLNDTWHLVSNEAIQMHGGIGMTDEHEIGFFIKRARVCEQTFGNSAFHRDRYGVLHSY